MKRLTLISMAAASFPILAQAAAWSAGDLVVVRVGDGTTTLANSGGPIGLLELNPLGSLVQTISIPSSSGGLQVSGTATSEGQLLLNPGGASLTLAGYVPPFTGSGSLAGRTSTQAPRGFVTIDGAGTVSSTTPLGSAYSGQNIRSGLTTPSGSWFTGSGTSGAGLSYFDGTSATQIQGINSRVLNTYQGDLFYSTGSGAQGLYRYSGMPTTATTATAFLTGVTGQGTSPYDFAFAPNGQTLYVADDGIGVQKFTFDGTSWSLAYNFTPPTTVTGNKAYGLAVDFSGSENVIYWTTPNDLYRVVDTGAGAVGSSIFSAGANYALRGLEFAPIPEPSTVSLFALGLVFFGRRVFGRRSQ